MRTNGIDIAPQSTILRINSPNIPEQQ